MIQGGIHFNTPRVPIFCSPLLNRREPAYQSRSFLYGTTPIIKRGSSIANPMGPTQSCSSHHWRTYMIAESWDVQQNSWDGEHRIEERGPEPRRAECFFSMHEWPGRDLVDGPSWAWYTLMNPGIPNRNSAQHCMRGCLCYTVT